MAFGHAFICRTQNTCEVFPLMGIWPKCNHLHCILKKGGFRPKRQNSRLVFVPPFYFFCLHYIYVYIYIYYYVNIDLLNNCRLLDINGRELGCLEVG